MNSFRTTSADTQNSLCQTSLETVLLFVNDLEDLTFLVSSECFSWGCKYQLRALVIENVNI